MSNRAVRRVSAVLLVSVLLFTIVSLAPAAAQASDAYPGYTLVETISVSSCSGPARSSTVLTPGTNYKLEASGWFYGTVYVPPSYCFPGYPYPDPSCSGSGYPIPGQIVDAEYVDGQDTWMPNPYVTFNAGIRIADSPAWMYSGGPHWGPYNPAHIYTVDYTGAGQSIPLVFIGPHLGCPSLTVKIYAPAYYFGGFRSPVDGPVNTGKAGRTFPIKWQLRDAGGSPVNNLALIGPITYAYTGASCGGASGGTQIPAETSGKSSLRYDADAQQYVFNWDTPPTPGCYTLSVTVNSILHEATFDLK